MKPNRAAWKAGLLVLAASASFTLAQEAAPPAGEAGVGRLAICHIVPWQTINHNVGMGQRYYDMSTQLNPGGEIEALRAEMALAASYGADAFAMDVIPELERPPEQSWSYEGDFVALLKAAAGTPWKVLPNLNRLDDKSTPEGMCRLLEKWGDNPNWLHVDGRPVFITFWAGRYPPETLRKLRAAMEQRKVRFFLAGDPDCQWDRAATTSRIETYRGLFDMLFTFAELGRAGFQTPLDAFRTLAQASGSDPGSKGWVAGLSPGYLGAWVSGRNDYYTPFRGFDQFLQSCEAAVETKPNWLYLTTWNDRDETALQPSIFQWDSMCRVFRYYIGLWRTGAPPPGARQLFAAYSREQILGTFQRIELLSLPGSRAEGAVVSGELRGNNGERLAILSPRPLTGVGVERIDWAVDTADLGSSPVVVPVLTVKGEGGEQSYTLPSFRLRSGWIENQVVLKAPLDEIAAGTIKLRIEQVDANRVHASYVYEGPETIRSAELFRNDRRVASFDSAHAASPRMQILLHAKKPMQLRLTVNDGSIVRADRGASPTPLKWDAEALSSTLTPGLSVAVELTVTPSTVLHFAGDNGDEITLSIADLLRNEHTAILGPSLLQVEVPKFDALVDSAPPVKAEAGADGKAGELTYLLSPRRPADGYFVRLETASGKSIESRWIFPGSLDEGSAPVAANPIWEVRTPVSLDVRKSTDWFSSPALPAPSVVAIPAHPAILQAAQWNFNDAAAPESDDRGHYPLILGRGEAFLAIDPKRVPLWIAAGGPDRSGCLEFDGATSRAQLPVQQEPKGPCHIALDLFPSGTPENDQCILAGSYPVDAPGAYAIYLVRRPDGRLAGGRGKWAEVVAPDPVPPERWVHVDLTFTGDKLSLSLDGNLVASAACDPAFQRFGNSRLYLGGESHPFRGRLDNVTIEGYASAGTLK